MDILDFNKSQAPVLRPGCFRCAFIFMSLLVTYFQRGGVAQSWFYNRQLQLQRSSAGFATAATAG